MGMDVGSQMFCVVVSGIVHTYSVTMRPSSHYFINIMVGPNGLHYRPHAGTFSPFLKCFKKMPEIYYWLAFDWKTHSFKGICPNSYLSSRLSFLYLLDKMEEKNQLRCKFDKPLNLESGIILDCRHFDGIRKALH